MDYAIWLVIWVPLGNQGYIMAQQPLKSVEQCKAVYAMNPNKPDGQQWNCLETLGAASHIFYGECTLMERQPNGTDFYHCDENPADRPRGDGIP